MNESISGPDLIDPVAENLSYENIRDNSRAMDIVYDIREKFQKHFPEAVFDESSPLFEMTCQFVYREILLRSRINDVCKKHLEFLKIIQRAKRKPFGLMQYYIDEAVNFEGIKNPDGSITGIKDASGVKKTEGTIELSILSDSEDGNPSDELIASFKEYINRDDVKVWNDTIEVARISTIGVEIKAQARPVYGTQIDLSKIKEKFISAWNESNRLGKSRTRSWILSRLHAENVDEIIISEITLIKNNQRIILNKDENISLNATEWAYLIKEKIKVDPLDWKTV